MAYSESHGHCMCMLAVWIVLGRPARPLGESTDSQAAEKPSRYLVSVVEDIKVIIAILGVIVIIIFLNILYSCHFYKYLMLLL